MEGLIKGLMDVALGALEDRGRDDDRDQDREERSRSTWSEVVSGELDAEEGGRGRNRRQQGHDSSNDQYEKEGWGRGQGSRPARQSDTGVNEAYRMDGSGQRHGYEPSPWNRKEEIQDQNEGWETVKRPPNHHQVRLDHWQGYKRPPSEQEYSDDVQISSDIEPTRRELSDLSLACNKLWDLDLNRLVPGRDYQIDCGEGKKVYGRDDVAEGSLYSWLSEDVFRRPTYSRFCSLLDNYNPHEGSKEVVTSEEKQEQVAFVEEISRTAPIKYLHRYLSLKGIVSDDYGEFKRMLIGLWFELYGRGGTSGSSSAFEHVFVGEIKQRGEEEVSGFHNWLQFYLEEAKGRVDYQGYIFPRRRGELVSYIHPRFVLGSHKPDAETQLLTIQFKWNGVLKAVSSTMVGVSPEFEVALYTLCFFVGKEDNHVELGPYQVNIKCYRLGNRIGSAFPQSDC